jgi:signal transduction histidine kinase
MSAAAVSTTAPVDPIETMARTRQAAEAASQTEWLPPRVALRAYVLGWIPLFLVYMISIQTDGDFSRNFVLADAFFDGLRGIGPAFLLGWLVWPYIVWMERHGFGPTRIVFNHLGMAVVFSAIWHIGIYLLIWSLFNQADAERARRNWFIWQGMWGAMLYWAVAGGFSAYRAVQRARVEAAASAQAQALLARSELTALRNKLNPHFLFNTLHSMIALVRRDAVQAEAALLRFSDMLRYVLDTEKSGEDEVLLEQELDFVRDYLALEALRLGHRLSVRWAIEDRALAQPIAALSIQPLVENSIKHAFNPRSAPGQLAISAKIDDAAGQLVIEVADDGPGCDPADMRAGGGLGIVTVSRRLALQHPGRAELRITTAPGEGFRARLLLPLLVPVQGGAAQ